MSGLGLVGSDKSYSNCVVQNVLVVQNKLVAQNAAIGVCNVDSLNIAGVPVTATTSSSNPTVLPSGSKTIDGDLTVEGNIISTNGSIEAKNGNLTISGQAQVGSLNVGGPTLTLSAIGSKININATGDPSVPGNTSCLGVTQVINTGTSTALIYCTRVTANSVIFVTAASGYGANLYVTKNPGVGFQINFIGTLSSPSTFFYIVFN